MEPLRLLVAAVELLEVAVLPTDCHVFLKTGPIMETISSNSSTEPTQVVKSTCPIVLPLAWEAG